MEKIRLEIIGMSYSQSQSGAYALIMGEVGSKRRLPIIIGGFEAQSIAIELEKMKPSRPLTHDLFKNFADNYNISIREVIIDKFQEGVFFAKLVCVQNDIVSDIDSRTSDAVALAIRFNCPIYTYEKILAEAGILMDEKNENEEKPPESKSKYKEAVENPKESFEEFTLNELYELLKKTVDKEEYEKASLIRDEINRRKGKD
jgi:hypothetical protein